MRVLYVEDEPVNVAIMKALFELMPDAELEIAVTGEDGYRKATENPPDLLLLDLRLPDCHGKQLLERMRHHPGLAHVPAAAVTAEHQPDLSDSSFSELWLKPLDVPRVMHCIERFQKTLAHTAA